MLALGKVPMIKGEKLYIEPNEWFVPIGNDYPPLQEKYLRLELDKQPLNKEQKAALATIRSHWLRALEAFRTAIWQIPGNISPFKIVNYW